MPERITFRQRVLESLGADRAEIQEVIQYNENHFQLDASHSTRWPLPDEPFVAAWREYAVSIQHAGGLSALNTALVQLSFPIEAGISQRADYIAVTRMGADPGGVIAATGLKLSRPEQCRLLLHSTLAGHIPALVAENRQDFVALVCAFTGRNEPVPVPTSKGAAMISGYNNWDRIRRLREEFESASPNGSWATQWERVKGNPLLYKDRFILLSTGPYSGVQAVSLGLDNELWRELSLTIRLEHESTHYVTRRCYCSMRNNLLDELIADFFGIRAAAGRFRADWFLHFMGLENYPYYRFGGRLQNYRGQPPLSDGAFRILQDLTVRAAKNVETFDRTFTANFDNMATKGAVLAALASHTIEEMASDDGPELLAIAFENTHEHSAESRAVPA
jgi:hypothetical protein